MRLGHLLVGLVLGVTSATGCCKKSTPLVQGDAVLTDSPIDFGDVPIGQTKSLPLTLRNAGSVSLHLSAVTLAGAASSDFGLQGSFPVSLEPGATASVPVEFAPTELGTRDGAITFTTDSTANPTVQIALTGVGVDVVLVAQATSLDFGPVQVGSSKTLSWTLTNQGTSASAAIQISQPSGPQAAEFSWTGATGALEPGQAITLQVTFSPSKTGAASAAIPYQGCATCGAQSLSLSGAGVDGTLTFTPAPISFPSVPTGQRSSVSVTAQNSGSGPLAIASLGLGTPSSVFSVQGLPSSFPATPVQLAPGAQLTFQVTYAPTGSSGDADEIAAGYAPPGVSSRTAVDPIVGNGATAPCSLALTPTALAFGTLPENQAATATLSLTNQGGESCKVTQIALAGSSDPSYGLPSAAPLAIAPGGSGQIAVSCDPTSASPSLKRGLLDFATNDPSQATVQVPLSATVQAVSQGACTLSIQPPALDFGTVTAGQRTTLSTALSNTGSASCSVSAIALASGSDPGFSLVSAPSTLTLAVGQSASLTAACDLSAGSPSLRAGKVTFQSNDPSQPTGQIPLSAYLPGSGPYGAGWPKLYFDDDNSSRTTADTSGVTGRLLWKFAIGAVPAANQLDPAPTYVNSPVVAANGTVFQLGMDGTLYALNPSGAPVWTLPGLASPQVDPYGATPFIAADGTLYLVSGSDPVGSQSSGIYHVSAQGTLLWTGAFPAGSDGSDVPPLIGHGGELFLFDDYTDCEILQPQANGSLTVVESGLPNGSPERNAFALGADDTSYWNLQGAAYGVSPPSPPSGGLGQLWQWPPASATSPGFGLQFAYSLGAELSIDEPANLIVVVQGLANTANPPQGTTGIAALTPATGSQRWVTILPSSPISSSAPTNDFETDVGNSGASIGSSGTLYVGSPTGLFALDPTTGSVLSGWPFPTTSPVSGTASIGGDGALFFGTADGHFYGLNADGSQRFVLTTGGRISSSPAIGPDGTVYFVSDDGNLYAVH
ncbi:MAG: choice-of-anchor D domain-containing protein [Deltaproteobacteria bacterium]